MSTIQSSPNVQKKMAAYNYLIIHARNVHKALFCSKAHALPKYHSVLHTMVRNAKHANMSLWNLSSTV